MAPALTFGADISGAVTDSTGTPLDKVPVCLQEFAGDADCLKLRFTDRKGNYSFNGLKPGDYSVRIFLDKSAAARKVEAYRTYVWTPPQGASIADRSETVMLPDFVGKFGYSNFQRAVELGAGDFPELAQVDLLAEPVFLKVAFQPAGAPDLPPETIFLGQVTDPAGVRLEATVPLAVTAIDYQVFSATYSYSGRISLAD